MLRGIVDLISTSTFLIAFDAACLSAARSHVNCYLVLLTLSLGLNNDLSCELIGVREDVVVELVNNLMD